MKTKTNSKVVGDENATKTSNNATKTRSTTNANYQGVVRKRAGTGISTVSISGLPAYKEMNLKLSSQATSVAKS